MILYKGARTKVTVGAHLSEELEVNVDVHQGSVLSPLLFAIVVDVVMNEIKVDMSKKYSTRMLAESMAELQEKFYGWKSALESKGLNVNLVKTKVMVSVGRSP